MVSLGDYRLPIPHSTAGGSRRTLVMIAAGWFLSIGVRLVYPVLLPYLRSVYQFDLTTAGLLLGVLWGAYAFGQIPAGLLSDRLGAGLTLPVATAISGAFLGLVVLAQTTATLFVATMLFGFGTSLYGIARLMALSSIFPDNTGGAIGATMAAGEAGNTILPPLAGFVAGVFSWRMGFGFTIPFFFAVSLGLWYTAPDERTATSGGVGSFTPDFAGRVFSLLLQPAILLITVLLLLNFAVWQAFTGFYPTYLIDIKGFSPTRAGLLFGAFFAMGVLAQPVSGHIYDRVGIRIAYPLVMGVFSVALLAVPVIDSVWSIFLVTVLLSPLLGTGAITLAYLAEVIPDQIHGTGMGVIRTVYLGGSAVSPVMFGQIADRGFFDEGFWILAVIAFATILLSLWLPEQ